MALRTPPSWLQNGSHPAENDRLTMQGIVSSTGILGSTSLAVTQSGTPAMTVQVAAGWGAIVGNFQSNMGVYTFYNDAATTLTITANASGNPRIDRIVATVNDTYYTGATNNVTFTVVAGTPAASPVAPATPTNSISLATVAVANGAASIVNANITDTRVACTSNLVDLSTYVSLTGTQTVSNKTLTSPEETWTTSATAATGTVNFDCGTQGVLYYTTNASANFTLNFRWTGAVTLASILPVGTASISVVFLNTNGASPFYPTAFQIDGSAVTPKWSGGTAPSAGNASAIDAYSFTIIKTAATPTYTVLAGAVKFA